MDHYRGGARAPASQRRAPLRLSSRSLTSGPGETVLPPLNGGLHCGIYSDPALNSTQRCSRLSTGAACDSRAVLVAVPPAVVFNLVADVGLLPTWNDAIDRLAKRPGVPLMKMRSRWWSCTPPPDATGAGRVGRARRPGHRDGKPHTVPAAGAALPGTRGRAGAAAAQDAELRGGGPARACIAGSLSSAQNREPHRCARACGARCQKPPTGRAPGPGADNVVTALVACHVRLRVLLLAGKALRRRARLLHVRFFLSRCRRGSGRLGVRIAVTRRQIVVELVHQAGQV